MPISCIKWEGIIMSMSCNRCEGTGFLNLHQIDDSELLNDFNLEEIIKWIKNNKNHDVQICDCCGDGETWYGIPGEHYNDEDPPGKNGPYSYNGGWCRCH